MATADEPRPRDIITSRAFERDVKRLRKAGLTWSRCGPSWKTFACTTPSTLVIATTPSRGSGEGFRDCHGRPDWVLIYSADDEAVRLTRSGPPFGYL